MSKIDTLIAELQLKKKKVEFLEHILTSAKDYDHEAFAEVKSEVVEMLENFTKNSIAQIEDGGLPKRAETPAQPAPKETPAPSPRKVTELSIHEKASFAMDNRHLSGKEVDVLNDKNANITGEVVGLDAPYVIVKVKSGHRIKVPIDNINVRS